MLCTGLFPNADTKIQHRRRPLVHFGTISTSCALFGSIMYTFARKRMQQITQVAQSAYPSGSVRLLKWLNQRVQPSAQASSAVCVSESSRLRNPVQPYPYPSSATSVGKRKHIVCLPHLTAQLLPGQISLSEDTTRANNSYHQGQLCVF